MAVETLEKKLAKLRREVQREWRPLRDALLPPPKRKQSRRDLFAAVCLGILKVATIAALPFFVCARASVFFYQHGAAPWAAVAGGALLMMVVVAVYAAWLSRHFSGRARARTIARWVALPLVAAWCGYAVQYLARTNAKSDDVRGYYSAVHPVLRIALATAILADPDVVVTDLGRVPADYPRMGLPVNERTKHYRQPNDWVHTQLTCARASAARSGTARSSSTSG